MTDQQLAVKKPETKTTYFFEKPIFDWFYAFSFIAIPGALLALIDGRGSAAWRVLEIGVDITQTNDGWRKILARRKAAQDAKS